MQFQSDSRSNRGMSYDKSCGISFLPGMMPSLDGCRIVIKPKRSPLLSRHMDEPLVGKTTFHVDLKEAATNELKNKELVMEESVKKMIQPSDVQENSIVESVNAIDAIVAEIPKAEKKKKIKKHSKALQNVSSSAPCWDMEADHKRVLELEEKLAQIKRDTKAELAQIEEKTKCQLRELHGSTTKEEVIMLKESMKCSKRAAMGKTIIAKLRDDNSRLRTANEHLAKDIAEMAQANASLESSIKVANDSIEILQGHLVTVEAAHKKLTTVIPQYETKIQEMEEALDERKSFGDMEHKTKVLYATILGTLSEMLENHCPDADLTDEVLELVLDCNDQYSITEMSHLHNLPQDLSNETIENINEEEYDEVTVMSED